LFVKEKVDYYGSAADKTKDPFGSRMMSKQRIHTPKRSTESTHTLLFGEKKMIRKAEAVAISMCEFCV
jgi:hypothetical protein